MQNSVDLTKTRSFHPKNLEGSDTRILSESFVPKNVSEANNALNSDLQSFSMYVKIATYN